MHGIENNITTRCADLELPGNGWRPEYFLKKIENGGITDSTLKW